MKKASENEMCITVGLLFFADEELERKHHLAPATRSDAALRRMPTNAPATPSR